MMEICGTELTLRISGRNETGKVTLESYQPVLSKGINKNKTKLLISRVRSKIKIVTSRLIGHRDETNTCCKTELCQKASQGMMKVSISMDLMLSKGQGQVR